MRFPKPDRDAYGIIACVAIEDSVDAPLDANLVTVDVSCQVGERQHVEQVADRSRKLRNLLAKSALGCLVFSSRVVRNQPDHVVRSTQPPEVPRPVDGVATGVNQPGCMTDVVQPCGGSKEAGVLPRQQRGANEVRSARDSGAVPEPWRRERKGGARQHLTRPRHQSV